MKQAKRNIRAVAAVFAFALLTAACVVWAAFAPEDAKKGYAGVAAVTDTALRTSYAYGDTYTVEQVELSYDGKTVPSSSAYVTYPSGKTSKASTVKLTESGLYTVTYFAYVDGVRAEGKRTFTVERDLFGFSGPKSTGRYGVHANDSRRQTGIVAEIAMGETFTFNRVIDLSKMPKDEIFLSFFVMPEEIGTADAKEIDLIFTDAYDENNYVDIRLKNVSEKGAWADPTAYVTAAPAGRQQMGVEQSDATTVNIHRNDDFGHPADFSLVGKPRNGLGPETNPFELVWNYDDGVLKEPHPSWGGGYTTIAEFHNPDHYADVWDEGFTTGEVFLSVRGRKQQKSKLHIVFTEIGGEDLSQGAFADTDRPTVHVDMQGYTKDTIPTAVVGKPYPLFTATATDAYAGKLDVTTAVYQNYGSSTASRKNVVNNAFVPTVAGTYTVVYTATDTFGNVGRETLPVQVLPEETEFAFTLSGKAATGESGKRNAVFGDVTYRDACGNVTLTVTATHSATGKVYDVSSDDHTFVPMDAGEYTVTVRANDWISEKTQTFAYTVRAGQTPASFETLQLPHFFVKGATYTLPTVTGYEFASGVAVPVTATVSVAEDGTEKANAVQNGKYTVGDAQNVTVLYRIGGTTVRQRDVPVADVGYGGNLRLAAYFRPTQGEIAATADRFHTVYAFASSDACMEFVNPVQIHDFSLVFAPQSGKAGMRAVHVTLTDCTDETRRLTVSFRPENGGTAITVNNGKTVYRSAVDFTDHGTMNYTLEYAADTNAVLLGALRIPLSSSFAGFAGSTAYLTVAAEGAASSALEIRQVNGQTISRETADFIEPQIAVNASYGDRAVGECIELRGAHAVDVIDPTVALTLTVTMPDGSIAVSREGVRLDGTCDPVKNHTLELRTAGEYTVTYAARDTAGNETSFTYGITAIDYTRPQIRVEDAARTGKAKQSVKIASASVDAGVTLYVYVERADGTLVRTTEKSFVPSVKGVYTVHYIAYDGSGNMNHVSYTVNVA